jgi:hypothetical protein
MMTITTSLGWGAFNLVQAQNSDPLPAEVVNAIAQKTIQKFNCLPQEVPRFIGGGAPRTCGGNCGQSL